MKITSFIALSILCFSSFLTYADERKSLSTSRFTEVNFYSSDGNITKTCSGKMAGYSKNYVSIGVEKLTVNKDDSFLKRIFNSGRNAFAVANLKADYQSQTLSVSKVGSPISIKGKKSSVDMGVQWGILDRIPWVLKNATLQVKLGYSADSSTDAMIEAFSSVTSAIPDYTISTSLATGFAIASSIDKLLFGADRSTDLLNAQRDLPLLAGQLCEGYYAIFSAENNNAYTKYYDGNVIWTGNDLTYQGESIKDVSYAVVSVKVSDRYYDETKNSINDTGRLWASRYQQIKTSFFDIIWATDSKKLNEISNNIRDNLLQARTLLASDVNLIQDEKTEIHQFMINEFRNQLEIAKSRIDRNGTVTVSSTQSALTKALNDPSFSLSESNVILGGRLLSSSNDKLLEVKPGFEKEFEVAIEEAKDFLSIK